MTAQELKDFIKKNSNRGLQTYVISSKEKEILDWAKAFRAQLDTRKNSFGELPEVFMRRKLRTIAREMMNLHYTGFFRYSIFACGLFAEQLLKEYYQSGNKIKFNDLIQKANSDRIIETKDFRILETIQCYRNEFAHEILTINQKELEHENRMTILMIIRLMKKICPQIEANNKKSQV